MTKSERLASLDTFTRAYLECLIWQAPEDDNGRNLDAYMLEDFTHAALRTCAADCRDFQEANAADLAAAGDPSQNGHDFCLTRNGHGAGFWDRGYPADLGERLSKASRVYGTADVSAYRGKLYVG